MMDYRWSHDFGNRIFESMHPTLMMYKSKESLIEQKINNENKKINILKSFIENEAQIHLNGVNFIKYDGMFSGDVFLTYHDNIKNNFIKCLPENEQNNINILIQRRIDEIKKNTSEESINELISMFDKKKKPKKRKN